ncbi:secondary thiamine-phosphate synthase enzyme YjbQ [Spirulina major CS-329]|uniref:secondary thiamine-phosphate synthase enzyme YjbQ n=1 Tax=Spirulina TaxID=1154 RepID=UPI0023309FF1|nr:MULTISPECIES: secondary thiamine-phosphate synthase enzyme YjbQ [Spirulina]MDB9496238.1 secondary thiamine-phosphate synthase enzyme YjbQ [Spirulina subsalsa CS-330]MDB9502255.1 secondary thiamine-phosphate synthase enzyme YjbQ [Spirulina major CS-329]
MPTQTAPLIHQQILTVQTQGKTLHDITRQVESVVADSGIVTGLCVVFVRHTSASLIIQENADPDVLRDLNHFFAKLVPEDGRSYIHAAEGPDDMPAHIRSAITKTSESIPISNGRLVLGTWQGLYLWEHRQRSHRRQIVIHNSGLG